MTVRLVVIGGVPPAQRCSVREAAAEALAGHDDFALLYYYSGEDTMPAAIEPMNGAAWTGWIRQTGAGWRLAAESSSASIVRVSRPSSSRLIDRFRLDADLAGDVALVAFDSASIEAIDCAAVTFYVGNDALRMKYRNTVPLNGQGVAGLVDVLGHLAGTRNETVLRVQDLPGFADRARAFYLQQDAPRIVHDRAIEVARSICKAVPGVDAVFGSGFPFYLGEDDRSETFGPTPPSILAYLASQAQYFRAKACRREDYEHFERERANCLSRLRRDRDYFDVTEFTRLGAEPPSGPEPGETVHEAFAANQFDIAEDIWPCQYCTYFHDRHRFPTQPVVRGFNEECHPCRQTALALRNVMGCAADVDLVIAVAGDRRSIARRVEQFIRTHDSYFLHDTDLLGTVLEYRVPLDLFVVSTSDLRMALAALAEGALGEEATMGSEALWLPMRSHYPLEIGAHFALAFELLYARSDSVASWLKWTRQQYALKVDATSVCARLEKKSAYHRQLLSNAWIRANLGARLRRWREARISLRHSP